MERFGATLSLAPPRGFAIADVDQRGGLDWILVDRVNRRLTVRRNQQTAAEVRVVDGETAESIIGVKLPTIFSIAAVSAEKPEGGVGASTPFTFQISRDPRGDNNAASSVRYTVAGSGANPANGADFVGGTLPFGDVFFVAGEEGPKTISVFVQGDSNAEPREEFEVTLSNAVNANIEPAFTKASGIIRSDDAALFMTETPVSKREGQSGTTAFTFIVSRLDGTGTPTVKYNVSGAGLHPAESSDFGTTFPSGSVKFASGKTEVTITINVKGDTLVEDDESVGVYDEQFLLTATSADFVGVTSTKIGTIVNDDASFAISTAIGTLLEGGPGQTPEFVFTVTRTGDISGTASVKYAVDGFVPANTTGVLKAVASDFADGRMPPSDTLKFAANESVKIIRIRIKGDATGEPDKGFRVMLSNNSTGTIIPAAQAFALGRIDDDD